MSPAHSIISSRLLLPFFPAAAGSMCPAKREQRRRKRDGGKKRRMERQEEERMRAYIKAAFTDICALGAERPYEYQYEPMERKHSPFFPPFSLSYSCTQEIHSSQRNGQSVSLCTAVWTVLLCLNSFPLMTVACVSEKHSMSSATVVSTTVCKSDWIK